VSDIKHSFGNINLWTKDKLVRLEKYLSAYTTALKKTNFILAYIDAFAGTGRISREIRETPQNLFGFEEGLDEELKDFIDGSAKIALQTEPQFHKYIFIEKNKNRFSELQKLKEEFPTLASKIEIVNAEANIFVQDLCKKDWIKHNRRAVMFLDPYGMQVSWKTIEAIANTKAIDLWILFPIGTVNRLLNKNGKINKGRRKSLDILFGKEDWFEMFFEERERISLFTQESEKYFGKKASFETIAQYFNDKLKSVFTEVAPNPLFLSNSNNSPIFLLCFAAGNPKGAPIAVKIAQNILKQR
jgi:three-Cys-motif partner protein